jgi:hypothetical protein
MINLKGEPLKFGTVAFKPDDVNAPVGWAMVRNGQFSIAANAGPVPGKYHVAVTDMGAVAPGPTVDDAKLSPAEVVFEITEGSNELSIDLP